MQETLFESQQQICTMTKYFSNGNPSLIPLKRFVVRTPSREVAELVERRIPFNDADYVCVETSFPSRDGTMIPLFLVGRGGLLKMERIR